MKEYKHIILINILRKACGYKFPRSGKFINQLFFKICPNHVRCELFPGINVKLDLRDQIQLTTFWQGDRFEYPTAHVLQEWGGKKFFDIGANYGFYSIFMLDRADDVNVYAFEPNPVTFKHLESIKKNNSLDRLSIFNLGLGSRTEYLELHPGTVDSGHSTFLDHPELSYKSMGRVEVTTFDSWMREMNISYPEQSSWVAKIDVEGMELSVLKGMKDALMRKVFKGICIEVIENTLILDDYKPEDLFNYLGQFGYFPISKDLILKKFGRISTENVFFEPQ